MATHGYGWRPQLPDQRDHRFAVEQAFDAPVLVDLRAQCPPVYDQGQLGSCTAFACASALQIQHTLQHAADAPHFSELFIYYNERVLEHSVNSDNGAEIRDGFKTMGKTGACTEDLWPYDVDKFADKPPREAYVAARADIVPHYAKIRQRAASIEAALATNHVVVIGFSVYDSFESQEVADTGMVPLPAPSEDLLGGHAVTVVGYDRAKSLFIVRNSWSDAWGDKGYFYMPYAYLTNPDLSSDFWAVTAVKVGG